MSVPLVEVRALEKSFVVRRGLFGRRQESVKAVDGVDLSIERGETLAIVGESASGKTTLGRCMTRLIEPDRGQIIFDGQDLCALRGSELRRLRRRFQMVFQDPLASLDPRQRIGAAVAEPIEAHRLVDGPAQVAIRVADLLERVGLDDEIGGRFPHQLSGGQRQRVAIARALATEPDLIIADEPVAALDVSVRSQVVNLLLELQADLGLAILFIAHDLALVEQIADRIAVMFHGRIVESGVTAAVMSTPAHPYTVRLIDSVLDSVAGAEPGEVRLNRVAHDELPPSRDGCSFASRCPIVEPKCRRDDPDLREISADHHSACHFPQAATTLTRRRV